MSKADYFKELNHRLRGLPEKERQNILSVYEELFQKAIENGKHEDDVAESLGYPRIPSWNAQNQVQNPASSHEQADAEARIRQQSAENAKNPAPEAFKQTYSKAEIPYSYEPIPSQYAGGSQGPQTAPPPPPHSVPTYTHIPPYPHAVKAETGIKAIIVSIALGFFNLIFVVGPWFGLFGTLIGLFAAGFALLVAPVIGVVATLWGSSGEDMRLIVFAMLACFGLGLILTSASTWLFHWFFKLTGSYIRFNAKLIKGA
ncbi:HAAS signaling domain-containing protein [Paenibacillus hexagrammi]|uniref:DUF1700 domain-containing protein n=1 Tax=Paenibacillus hexagrammi TaxID=2908839 RepID=A0ABY3SJ64_9BACL|nr:DUF1700 domain-containing protein [Paenibacillus sp. YPD9-1]UJF33181.1 DUF1700 domain-containing protein [Paenibacillus sp. YPD9-1]